MSETVYVVTVASLKKDNPLPERTKHIIGQRLYDFLYSQGYEVGVYVEEQEEKRDESPERG